MSFSIYQKYFDTIKENVVVNMGIVDDLDLVVASNDKNLISTSVNNVKFKYTTYPLECDKSHKLSFFIEERENYDTKSLAGIIISSLVAIKDYDREFDDIEYFYSQAVAGKLENKSQRIKSLKITDEQIRAVFVIRVSGKHLDLAKQIVDECISGRKNDCAYIGELDNIVLIRSCKTEPTNSKLVSVAQQISVAIMSEIFEQPSIGIGCLSDELSNLHKAYKTAIDALEIGYTFESRNKIYSYMNLGISRLISSVSVEKCKAFLNEIFPGNILSEIDADTMNTIQRFFDFDLNISLAARELYIHRNTLVYRLDRVQKLTGLDVRKFDDALLFKIAMLIQKHLISTKR